MKRFYFIAKLHATPVERKLSGTIEASTLRHAIQAAGLLLEDVIADPPANVTEWQSIDLKIRTTK